MHKYSDNKRIFKILHYLCVLFTMDIQGILDLYAKSPQTAALTKLISDDTVRTAHIEGALASAMPVRA